MTKIHASIAAVSAALLLSGNAFAAPAAGEAPFADAPVLASSVQRQDVRADAARNMPAAGEQSGVAVQAASSDVTRAEVRAATRDAIAHGHRVASGESA
ncbi:MAG: hypothetical protein JSR92_10975 [Proteobacteria bacterium]|jgi:hypothetical protein|nr:hypothetical protein [Pseudomonadota bacterium]